MIAGGVNLFNDFVEPWAKLAEMGIRRTAKFCNPRLANQHPRELFISYPRRGCDFEVLDTEVEVVEAGDLVDQLRLTVRLFEEPMVLRVLVTLFELWEDGPDVAQTATVTDSFEGEVTVVVAEEHTSECATIRNWLVVLAPRVVHRLRGFPVKNQETIANRVETSDPFAVKQNRVNIHRPSLRGRFARVTYRER